MIPPKYGKFHTFGETHRENGTAGSAAVEGPGETGDGDNSCSLGGSRSGRNGGSDPGWGGGWSLGCEPGRGMALPASPGK